MHIITVSMKYTPIQFFFVYKTRESAISAWSASITAASSESVLFPLSDDYGQNGLFTLTDSVFTLTDVDANFEGQIARSIRSTKANIKGEELADADQIIRSWRAKQNFRGQMAGFPGVGSATGGFKS